MLVVSVVVVVVGKERVVDELGDDGTVVVFGRVRRGQKSGQPQTPSWELLWGQV